MYPYVGTSFAFLTLLITLGWGIMIRTVVRIDIDMCPLSICVRYRYVAVIDIFPLSIYSRYRYVSVIDMLPLSICCRYRYVSVIDISLMIETRSTKQVL